MAKRIFSTILALLLSVALFPAQYAKAADFTPVTGHEMMEKLDVGYGFGVIPIDIMNWALEVQNPDFKPQDHKEITPELFEAIAMKGFNYVRLDVHWGECVDENYKIDKIWLDRAEAVVNWALDAGLYVILLAGDGPAEDERLYDYGQCRDYLTTVWGQVAERLKNHSERVMFEVMGEPHGDSWDISREVADIVNKLNADCLETIRQSGGYNDKRIVLLPPAGASVTGNSALEMYEFPDDQYAMACVHAYTPWEFCLSEEPVEFFGSDSTTFNVYTERSILDMFERLDSLLIAKNIPFVMGETGPIYAREQNERLKWVECYVTEAKKRNMPVTCFYAEAGLNFRTLRWNEPEYFDAIFETYGVTPGKNYIKNISYDAAQELNVNSMKDYGDGWWTFDWMHGLTLTYDFEKADAVVFECESEVLKTWGNSFTVQYVAGESWEGAEYHYPDAARLNIDGNKVVLDIRGLAHPGLVSIGGGRPDLYESLKRVYLESSFAPDFSMRGLLYAKTAYANNLIPQELLSDPKAKITSDEFSDMLIPILQWASNQNERPDAASQNPVDMLKTAMDALGCKSDVNEFLPNGDIITREDGIIAVARLFELLADENSLLAPDEPPHVDEPDSNPEPQSSASNDITDNETPIPPPDESSPRPVLPFVFGGIGILVITGVVIYLAKRKNNE